MKRPIIPMCLVFIVLGLRLTPTKVFATVSDFTTAPHTKYSYCNILPRIYGGNQFDIDTFNKIRPSLPVGTQPTNNKGIGLNFVIWHDKGLVVYGDYTSVPNNGFKEGTKGFIPYYFRNGIAGEYRYYGYDYQSNRFTNMNFKDDINSSLKLDQRKWVFKPWDSDKVKAADKTGSYLSQSRFNDFARRNDTFIQGWFNAGVPQLQGAFDNVFIDSGISFNPGSDKQIWNFLNVLSIPTPRYDGCGRMWRLAESGAIYYQTFPIKKFKKLDTPVAGEVIVENLKDFQEVIDSGSNNPAGWRDQTIVAKLKVTAELKDEAYISSERDKYKYYTRNDIIPNGWEVALNQPIVGVTPVYVSKSQQANTTTWYFNATFTKGQIKDYKNFKFTGTALVNFVDKEKSRGPVAGGLVPSLVTITSHPTPEPTPSPKPGDPPAEAISINVNFPKPAYDIVKYTPTDNTTLKNGTIVSRDVTINGQPVDYTEFFSGNYVFGIGNDGEKNLEITYISDKGHKYYFSRVIYVYNTKPYAQFNIVGSFKQNRLLKVTNTSPGGNLQIVQDNYPIISYQWAYRGITADGSARRIRDISDVYKELMYKKPGVYEIELAATNSLGRTSDPHIVRFEIFEDYKPAVDIGMNATDVARGETLSSYSYGAVSTDGDTIAANIIELWYDSNNDGVYDRKLNTYDGKLGFPVYNSTALGKYKYVNTVTESFGEPTMAEYITPEDTVSKTVEVEFTVDNYRPSTDIFVDIPIVRPLVDTLILMDANLDGSKTEYLKMHRMDYNNFLRGENILPTVEMWDMKTYTYSQPASTSLNTGSSFPPNTVPYSSNGYSGTLNRTSYNNNQYTEDHSYYENRSTSRTFSGSYDNTLYTHWDCSGRVISQGSTGDAPGSLSINEDGYSGSIPRVSTTQGGTSCDYCSEHGGKHKISDVTVWTANYEGTLYKTESILIPNIVTYDNYTGYYTGTIYKSIRQPYTPSFTPNAYKYIIYISDGTISELSDLQAVRCKADAKLILIGSDAIRYQTPYDYFIPNNGRTVDALMNDALKIITQNNPSIPKYTVLAGVETFNTRVASFDEENDPITEQRYQYVQDYTYYDNSTGINPLSVIEPSGTEGWTDTKLTTFSKVGRYEIYTRAKDRPSTDSNFAEYSYYSGTPYITVYAHRKPIALATLDWDYDAARNIYLTRWVDKSYDLDHNISMANKGIADRKIMFRKDGGEWLYYIPSELVYGNYELQYYVKDVEGVWSDPWTYNFTLAASPSIQFGSELRSQLPDFGINSAAMGTGDLTSRPIPSTEALTDFNIWTRYPYSLKIQSGFWNGSGYMAAFSTNTSNYSASGNDKYWGETTKGIPPRKADGSYLYDGVYTYRISAVSDVTGLMAYRDFSVRISTPINLVPSMPSLVMTGENYTISSTASKYTESVSVLLYAGTPYQMSVALPHTADGGNVKTFSINHLVPQNIPAGTYTAIFTATAVNGGTEVKALNYTVETLKITGVSIKGYWNHWRGQVDIFGTQMTNEPHRFLSYEAVKIDVTTAGNPDRIVVEFSPELQAMMFTDKYGNVYDYKDATGKYVAFPLQLNMTSANTATIDYTLPLAISTKDIANNRLRSGYWMKVTAYKGSISKMYEVNDIDITGNIYDHIYIQPAK